MNRVIVSALSPILPALLLLAPGAVEGSGGGAVLQPGATITLGEAKGVLISLETLPFVENEYTRRFKFDSFENPKLQELRHSYKLDKVTAPGRDEFERQILLMDWAHQQFKKFGHPSADSKGALQILQAIEDGQTFFCKQYAEVLVSAAASLGWVDRPLALRRHQGVAKIGGSTEHSVTEIWSNQYRKWIMLDPTSNLYLEKKGVPLNAYEIRQEWFYHDGADLDFVIGKERRKYKKSDLPIFLQRFADFGELAVNPDELDKYGFIGYIPNTDLMDTGFDYGGMFITRDGLCDGTKWHVRTVPAHPATDPYFPIGQAALRLQASGSGVAVTLQTMTPNFRQYLIRKDAGTWEPSTGAFLWTLHPGTNQFEARTVNQFGVNGPISTATIAVPR